MNSQNSDGQASEEDDEEVDQQSDEEQQYFCRLPPANPIKLKPQVRELKLHSYYKFHFMPTPQSLNNATQTSILEANPIFNIKSNHSEHTIQSYTYHNQSKLIYQKYNHHIIPNSSFDQLLNFPTYFCNLNIQPQEQNQLLFIDPHPLTISFSSQFESGNLFAVYAQSESTYDLLLQNDTNSKGNTQWFYFSVSGHQKDIVITFNILNFYKRKSLFQQGLHPAIFSTVDNHWIRGGFDIFYTTSPLKKLNNKPYYCLTFSYKVQHDNDIIYFAHSYPYTYSRLQNLLNEFALSTQKYLYRKVLCKSLAQNYVDLLTITSNDMEVNIFLVHLYIQQNRNNRKMVVLMARQHSGETMGSFVMEGILRLLLSESQIAQTLRSLCIFKIIPMINPDGVIHGNYRSSLSGTDLNRAWKKPSKHLYPEIYYTKQLIQQLHNEKGIYLICDMHGHRQIFYFRLHSFFYGCSGKNFIKPRLFPYLLSSMSKQFSFSKCCFNTASKQKEKTARIQLWKMTKLYTIYTLENSFYGWYENQKRYHYKIEDYMKIGETFCQGLLKMIQDEQGQKKNQQENLEELKQELIAKKNNNELEEQEDESGSDSEISEQEFDGEELGNMLPKKYLKNRGMKTRLGIKTELSQVQSRKESQVNSLQQQQQEKRSIFSGQMSRKIQMRKEIRINKNKKEERVEEEQICEKSEKVMVDKCVQTDINLYREWLLSQRMNNQMKNCGINQKQFVPFVNNSSYINKLLYVKGANVEKHNSSNNPVRSITRSPVNKSQVVSKSQTPRKSVERKKDIQHYFVFNQSNRKQKQVLPKILESKDYYGYLGGQSFQ